MRDHIPTVPKIIKLSISLSKIDFKVQIWDKLKTCSCQVTLI